MVKRYNFEVASQFKITDQIVYVEARPNKNGKYVSYSDYAALLARHNTLKEAVAKLKEAVKKYFRSERLEILKRDARAEVDRLLSEEK